MTKSTDQSSMFVVPGTEVTDLIEKRSQHKDQNTIIIIGPGLRRIENRILCNRSGRLMIDRNPDRYWIQSVQRRYQPVKGDRVVGVVLNNRGNQVKVDIGTADYALLSMYAFEGATKKNRPEIKIGDVVYGQLLVAGKDVESELVCVTSKGKREGLGILPSGGFLFTVPTHVARIILHPDNRLLANLGSKFKYECSVGMNGKIWIKSTSTASTLYIADAIKILGHMTEEQIGQHCDNVLETFVKVK